MAFPVHILSVFASDGVSLSAAKYYTGQSSLAFSWRWTSGGSNFGIEQ